MVTLNLNDLWDQYSENKFTSSVLALLASKSIAFGYKEDDPTYKEISDLALAGMVGDPAVAVLDLDFGDDAMFAVAYDPKEVRIEGYRSPAHRSTWTTKTTRKTEFSTPPVSHEGAGVVLGEDKKMVVQCPTCLVDLGTFKAADDHCSVIMVCPKCSTDVEIFNGAILAAEENKDVKITDDLTDQLLGLLIEIQRRQQSFIGLLASAIRKYRSSK